MKIDPLIDTIKRSIVTGTARPVCIVDRTLLLDIIEDSDKPKPHYVSLKGLGWRKMPRAIFSNVKEFLKYISTSPYFNFIVLISALVMAALSLVAMFSFFLSQILLSTPNQYVNDRGTLVFTQPLATEHYMFLLNTADLWADSGIEVIKGDRVKITVSGSFYYDIAELAEASRENSTLLYSYFHKLDGRVDREKYSLRPDIPFGALLYRVQAPAGSTLPADSIPNVPEIRDETTHEISFVAPCSGILHFTVNDIYLTKEIIEGFAKDNPKAMSEAKKLEYLDTLNLYGDKIARKWFDDNCGEMLINVKITRDITKNDNIAFYDKVFIYFMRLFK